METTLTASLFSGGRAALAHTNDFRAFRPREARAPSHDRQPRRDVGLLAPVLARNLDGRPDRPAGIGLRDLRPVTTTCCAR
jgi:hypothetical protein